MANSQLEALGLLETKGLVALVEASDAMVKSAKVGLRHDPTDALHLPRYRRILV